MSSFVSPTPFVSPVKWGLTYPAVLPNLILLHERNFNNVGYWGTAYKNGQKYNDWLANTMVHENTHHQYYRDGKRDDEAPLPGVHRDFPAIWSKMRALIDNL